LVGAEHVAIIQSLLVTCRLHGVNAHAYSGRWAPARRSASRQPRDRAGAAWMECPLRRQSASIRPWASGQLRCGL